MFDNLKQIKKLKELKDALEKEKREVAKEGIRVVVNGKMEVEEISLNPELSQEKQEVILKECLNQAFRLIEKEAAQKMFSLK